MIKLQGLKPNGAALNAPATLVLKRDIPDPYPTLRRGHIRKSW
jgi:hypothetical protein